MSDNLKNLIQTILTSANNINSKLSQLDELVKKQGFLAVDKQLDEQISEIAKLKNQIDLAIQLASSKNQEKSIFGTYDAIALVVGLAVGYFVGKKI